MTYLEQVAVDKARERKNQANIKTAKGTDKVECPYCACITSRRHVPRCAQRDNASFTIDPRTLDVVK